MVKGDRPDRAAEHKKKTMKTTSQKKTSGSELKSRPEQRSTSTSEQTPKAVGTAPTEPRGVLRIDFAQREANRQLPTEQVLDLLQRRLRRAYELAEVVGKWVWVAFSEPQDQQTTAELSQLGFHWNSRRKVWQHPCGVFKGEPTDPRAKYQSFHPADQVAA
jgi:hypothetical protein